MDASDERGPEPLAYEEAMRTAGKPLPYFPPLTPNYGGTCNPKLTRHVFPWEKRT